MLAGLVVSVSSLIDVPQKTWQEMVPAQRIIQGESTRRFTTQLNEHFLWSKPFAKIQRAVDWNIAHDAGAAVSAGCTDWFFLNDELNTFDGGAQNANARAYMVQQVAHLLKQRGVNLVVAVVPDKTRIEQEHLCGIHRPTAFVQRAKKWSDAVRKIKLKSSTCAKHWSQSKQSVITVPIHIGMKPVLMPLHWRSRVVCKIYSWQIKPI